MVYYPSRQPRFRSNVPSINPVSNQISSNRWYSARIFQILTAPDGYEE